MKTIEELRPVVTEAIRSGYRLIGKLCDLLMSTAFKLIHY
jgi:hypothetical protein